jgi:hypothetical protein
VLSSFIILRQSIALRELETLGKRGLHEGGLDLLAAALTDLGIDTSNVLMDLPRRSRWQYQRQTPKFHEREGKGKEREIYVYMRAL